MRILHVLAPAQFGGLERVVGALAVGHRWRDHKVVVAPLLESGLPDPPLLAELRVGDVTVHPIVQPKRAYWKQLHRLAELSAEFRPDIVHSHGYLPDVLVAMDKRRDGAPIVTTVHGFTGGERRIRIYEWLQLRAHRRFDAVVAVSATIQERLVGAGIAEDCIHTVRNAWSSGAPLAPIAEARALLASTDVFTVGWVGRVSREKGLDVMVRAMPALSDLPLQLTIVGDGPERTAVEALGRALGVAHRLRWMGTIPDAGRFLRGFDALVLSSRTEGTPILLLEAMHACVPVVVSAVGGVPDVISFREGMLVPPEEPAALADAIRQTLINPGAAAERAARARRRLDSDFATGPWLEAYERVYRGIQNSAT